MSHLGQSLFRKGVATKSGHECQKSGKYTSNHRNTTRSSADTHNATKEAQHWNKGSSLSKLRWVEYPVAKKQKDRNDCDASDNGKNGKPQNIPVILKVHRFSD